MSGEQSNSLGDADNNKGTASLVVNVGLSFGVKAVSLLVSLIATPAYIAYFGNDELLGLWFTLLSVLTWILNCDMGIGNGLRNKLTEALADNDIDEGKRLVSSSYCFLVILSAIVCMAILLLSGYVPWNHLFNIEMSQIGSFELMSSIRVILLAIVVQFVLRLATSILYALQRSFMPALLNLFTNSILLVFVVSAHRMGMSGSLINLALVYFFAVNVPLLLATFYVFRELAPFLKPSLREVDYHTALNVIKLGAAFLWLQLMALLLNNTSSYLISILASNSDVVEYQIYFKVFTLASTLLGLATTPVWSAVTKAKGEGRYAWLMRLWIVLIFAAFAAFVLNGLLCTILQPIFDIWLGRGTRTASLTISAIFAVLGSLLAASNVVTSFANGLGELRLQGVLLTFGACLNIPMSIILVRLSGSYLGVLLANIAAYCPYVFIQGLSLHRYLRNSIEEQQ